MATETPRPRQRSLIGRFFAGFAALLDGTRRLLLNLLVLALIAAATVWLWQRLHVPALGAKTTLVLDLSGSIVDQASAGSVRGRMLAQLRGQDKHPVRLRDVLAVLDAAARDEQVTQALLLLDDLQPTGLVTLREVAAGIERFKAAGKKVFAWGAGYEQRQYFLAAHADEVWMHPMGFVFIEGFGRYRSYYKEAFDRLGVSANVVRAGKFKNAAETFSASGPSPQTVQADRVLYGSLWSTWTSGVERARKLPAGHVAAYIDGLPGTLRSAGGDAAKLALQTKLVDALQTRDEMRQRLVERGAADEKNKTFRQVGLREYLARSKPPQETSSTDRIAVVVAQGAIVDGRTGPGLVGGLSTGELIRRAHETEDVKAIILRVNSPGGSAYGSELVRRELELARAAGKPVVVSMGDLAASGGYWISMAADEIIADEATVTGSIGVVAMMPSAEDALAKVGVRSAGTTTTWLAGAIDVKRNPEARLVATVQSMVDHDYEHFVGLVARERKLARERVEAAAQGRVWGGEDAHKHALVDRLGTWADAVAAAHKLAKLPAGTTARLHYFESQAGWLQRVLKTFGLHEAEAADAAAHLEQGVAQIVGAAQRGEAAAAALPGAAAIASPIIDELAWLADVAARRRPFATAAHCLCAAP